MFRFHKAERDRSHRDQLVRNLTYIDLSSRKIATHSQFGSYRSKLRGSGLDFVEHKKYTVGDDYRQIDWSVLARTRQTFVKIHHPEKDIAVLLLADLSSSMDQGTATVSKRDVLIEAAATIAFSAVTSNMAVGLIAGARTVEVNLPPRKRAYQAQRILDALLNGTSRPRETNLEELVRAASSRLKHPSMVFILSDFVGAEHLLQQPLMSHLAHHHDVIPVVVEDHLERAWPALGGYVRVRDLETSDQDVLSLTRENCAELTRQLMERKLLIRRSFLRLGVIPVVLTTEGSRRGVLMEYFLRRKREFR